MPTPIVQAVGRQGRRMRRPQHTFNIRQRAWQICPFMIAPVLPGETMRQLLVQARIVSDPIKNPLIGWWYEQFYFYVKLRDMVGRDDFTAMMLDPSTSLASYLASSEAAGYYAFDGGVNWVEQCLQRVVEEYFRDEGETWNTQVVDGLPMAQLGRESWVNSLTLDTDMATYDVDVYADDQTAGGDDTLKASEVDLAMRQWHLLRTHGVTEMTYEDYLRSFGVRVPEAEEPHRPELLRYIREWTYPANTVDPSGGTPSSALSWSVTERADKDRFFVEPGFIFGVTVARPKVYLSNQKGAGAGMLDSAYAWLPAILQSNPNYSWKQFAETEGPLDGLAIGGTGGYWVDMSALFNLGDQFVNFTFPSVGDDYPLAINQLALPASGADDMHEIRAKYATEAMAEDLFVDDADTSGKTRVRSDGIVSLHIATTLRDSVGTGY